MIRWREEEWFMSVTILENTLTAAKGSYQLTRQKKKKVEKKKKEEGKRERGKKDKGKRKKKSLART